MRHLAIVAAVFSLLVQAVPGAQTPPVQVLVDRAAAYVAEYQQALSLVVAQERYDQSARYPSTSLAGGRDNTARIVLLSDFLLVRTPDGDWVPFRDVFERNGTPVRDRQERLSALFLENPGGAFEQARRIVDESARYNLGAIDRTINVPTLALLFLTDAHRGRVSFELEGPGDAGQQVVRFREVRGPTYVRTTNNRDLPVSGRYWIQESSGRVERTELRAADASMEGEISVLYRQDEAAGLWVPARMDEEYRLKSDRSEIRGTAVYSRYRRFQVTTSDEVQK